MKKTLITILATVLVCACIVGGTLAWLTDKTETITNTFTVGKVDIELTETTGNTYKMIPGNTIAKDPEVTVKAESEACWVFVKIDALNDAAEFIEYALATGWAELSQNSGIYYREQAATASDVTYSVFDGDKVSVKTTVTSEMMNALTDATLPALAITAYAVQQDATIADATAAWAIVNSNP